MPLELHAKTYYDNPLVQGGDEHYVTVPDFPSGGAAKPGYSGLGGWQMVMGSVLDKDTPLGGYLNVWLLLAACDHPDMHDAQMTLTASISYWLTRPSVCTSPGFVGVMTEGKYSVVRTTD